MLFVMGTIPNVGMTSVNSFGLSVYDMLAKAFPNLEIVTAVQYNAMSATNPYGSAAGNIGQLIALEFDGQRTGMAVYSERMRDHAMIRDLSSFRQKSSGGSWGAVWRFPAAVASILGI
jgi:hypothetical protein